mmetsp:Transcript_43895/g.140681  ORF Transcript_43895/g.140681 Transcript_43895/m.140681 type:complete len:225 (+) Transcript_43895:89-763(+)
MSIAQPMPIARTSAPWPSFSRNTSASLCLSAPMETWNCFSCMPLVKKAGNSRRYTISITALGCKPSFTAGMQPSRSGSAEDSSTSMPDCLLLVCGVVVLPRASLDLCEESSRPPARAPPSLSSSTDSRSASSAGVVGWAHISGFRMLTRIMLAMSCAARSSVGLLDSLSSRPALRTRHSSRTTVFSRMPILKNFFISSSASATCGRRASSQARGMRAPFTALTF